MPGSRRRPRPRRLRRRDSRRAAPWLVGLALLGLVGVRPTWAAWTDSADLTGTTVTAGTLDVRLDGSDNRASTTLTMAAMVPGSSAAEVVVVQNNGTAALSWTLSSSLGGAGATAYSTATALRLTVRAGGTRSGSGSSATCTGGTVLATDVALTSSSATVVTAQGPLAGGGSTSLCVQVALDAAAPSTLMGVVATVAVSVQASSVVT
ncbi:SipW-dependent-type signal peptide-containing protein [Nocardioides sp. GY 10127]|uniref:SipW-dependent-type signal peptide-containing protein n=1 Tax=Nocardioides sp. GY 10127 TaxID=2569762 RepID=UPI001458E093|nr:SipW-dependent-type signal peptide-containing protein [Nocardioides sp. GY 10127]